MTTSPGTQPQTDSTQRTSTSSLFSILAIVFGAVAVLFVPIVFGIAAIVLAGVAISKKERLAKVAMAVAVVGTIAGFILGAIVYSSMK
jgi:membrane protein DedA with SNARE-associated domain